MYGLEAWNILCTGFVLQAGKQFYSVDDESVIIHSPQKVDDTEEDALKELMLADACMGDMIPVAYMHHDANGTKQLFTVGGTVARYGDLWMQEYSYLSKDHPRIKQWDYKIVSLHQLTPSLDAVSCLLVCHNETFGKYKRFTADNVYVVSLGFELPMYQDYKIAEIKP